MLDVYDIYMEKVCKEDVLGIMDVGVDEESLKLLSMVERFMGMKFMFIMNLKFVLVLSKWVGFFVKFFIEDNGLFYVNVMVLIVFSLLGFCEFSDVKEINELVFLYLDGFFLGIGIEYLNFLIGCV